MTTLNRLTRPNFIEGRCTSMEEGFLFGLIPGVVTDINDPEGFGRVRVECPLIEPGVNLPNDNDGWIQVSEGFVVNAAPGGSHRLLQRGSQVIMQCFFGDPRKMVVTDCLPSRVDRPHPELNRANGTHGNVTPGDVIEINDDSNSAQVIARPNGVVQHISPDGTLTYQTAEEARLQLAQDGTSRIENNESFTVHTPDGTVMQRSAEGAEAILRADGRVDVRSPLGARLRLIAQEARLEGPLSELSQTMQSLRSNLSGFLGDAQDLLGELDFLTRDELLGDDAEEFLSTAGRTLGQLQTGLNQRIDRGIELLDRVRNYSVEDLGQTLMPQASVVLGIEQISSNLDEFERLSGIEVVKRLRELTDQVIPDSLSDLLDKLRHNPTVREQAILAAVVPDEFQSIQNVLGLDLHRIIAPVRRAIQEAITIFDVSPEPSTEPPLTPQERLALLREQVRTIHRQIPSRLRRFISVESLEILFQPLADPDEIIKTILGSVTQGLATQTHERLSQAVPWARATDAIADMTSAMIQGNDPQAAIDRLNETRVLPPIQSPDIRMPLQTITTEFSRQLSSSMESFNQLINAVPDSDPGALLRLGQTRARIETNLGAAGAIAQVGERVAELIGPSGINRIFADQGGAGMRTPWGSFSLGVDGGSLFSLGQLALRVGESFTGGQSSGIHLSPSLGTSLSSFFEHRNEDDDSYIRTETARIRVHDQTVYLESLASNTVAAHRIVVSPQGIFLDDINIEVLLNLPDRFNALELRLSALEAQGLLNPPPP